MYKKCINIVSHAFHTACGKRPRNFSHKALCLLLSKRQFRDLSVCGTDAGGTHHTWKVTLTLEPHIIQTPRVCSAVVLIMSSPTRISSYWWNRSSVYFLPIFHSTPSWAALEKWVLSFMNPDARSTQSVSAEPLPSSYTVGLSATCLLISDLLPFVALFGR